MIPWAHPSHNADGISIGSAVFTQLTAECPYTFQQATIPPSKLSIPMGDLDPSLIHGSWAHPSSQPKMHLHRFSRYCRAH